jgi:hypothetical protein
MGYDGTAFNRTVTATPPGGGLGFSRLGHYITTPPSPTFGWHANLAVCFIVPPKRQLPPERYVKVAQKLNMM